MLKIGFTFGAIFFATGVAFGQNAGDRTLSHGTLRHRAQDSELLQKQQAVKVRLAEAAEIAEGKDQGRAIWAVLNLNGDPTQYEIKVLLADGKLVGHDIDARTGRVLRSRLHLAEAFFKHLEPAEVYRARTTLLQAIILAEEKTNSKAFKAEVKEVRNVIGYEITLVTNGRDRIVQVREDGESVLAD